MLIIKCQTFCSKILITDFHQMKSFWPSSLRHWDSNSRPYWTRVTFHWQIFRKLSIIFGTRKDPIKTLNILLGSFLSFLVSSKKLNIESEYWKTSVVLSPDLQQNYVFINVPMQNCKAYCTSNIWRKIMVKCNQFAT